MPAARTLKLREAAELLGCATSTLTKRRVGLFVELGGGQRLRLLQIGRTFRVSREELERFLAGEVGEG